MPHARIGVSGWRYPSWRGDFYPKGLPQRLELTYAAERMTSIEVNGSFYSLQRPSSYAAWRAAVLALKLRGEGQSPSHSHGHSGLSAARPVAVAEPAY